MDKIKLEDFVRDHPGEIFPENRLLSEQDTTYIRRIIASKLGLAPNVAPLNLVRAVADKAMTLPQINAEDESPDFRALLYEAGVNPRDKVLINWYRFDRIDEMSLDDFSRYFGDLWYPAADNIDLFDHSLSWILTIDYSGTVSLLRL
jgi:hypothetical protein